MTGRQRIMAIRVMDKMENIQDSNRVEELKDGTMIYKNENGKTLVTAKMKRIES